MSMDRLNLIGRVLALAVNKLGGDFEFPDNSIDAWGDQIAVLFHHKDRGVYQVKVFENAGAAATAATAFRLEAARLAEEAAGNTATEELARAASPSNSKH